MARKFSELREKMSPAARAASDREFQRMVEEMPLRKLRAARELTQENLASVLRVKQSEISKIERRADMYLSTLASYVKALGGTLELRAAFPNGEVIKINQFESLTEPGTATVTSRAKANAHRNRIRHPRQPNRV
jgi:transcriptional regulator with XRE-family HTH domain